MCCPFLTIRGALCKLRPFFFFFLFCPRRVWSTLLAPHSWARRKAEDPLKGAKRV